MKQKAFENAHSATWERIQTLLIEVRKRDARRDPAASEALRDFPRLYRQLCQHLALALQRGYSPSLCDQLQVMVNESHEAFYRNQLRRPALLRHWMLFEFPRLVREEWRLLCLSLFGFWGVGALVALWISIQPDIIYSFSDATQLEKYRGMYQPGQMNAGRGAQGDLAMFGMYIWNNVSIGFRTFAGGVFGGIPALISVCFNGIKIAVVAVWLNNDPATRIPFWSFVITHSSFEITGLILSAMTGMRLGLALIHPGRLRRHHALQVASQRMFPVMIGAALLTALAAFFEAFWSANPLIPSNIKFIVGGICWFAVLSFFVFAGRSKN